MAPDSQPCRFRPLLALTLCTALLLGACAARPNLKPSAAGTTAFAAFPQGRWQLVHRIEARFPGDHKALMMGALELDSATGHLTCALMTVEGFTLFSASETDRLRVTRAVPPFDGPGFAAGLMDDLRLLFFVPRAPRLEHGTLADGPVRRYHHPDGRTTDLVAPAPGIYRIDRYAAGGGRLRRVELTMGATPPPARGIADHIRLEAPGKAGYSLRLDLIDAVPLGSAPEPPITGSTAEES